MGGEVLQSDDDVIISANRDGDSRGGDIIFKTSGVERARLRSDGTGTGGLGGSQTYVVPNAVNDAAAILAAAPDIGLRVGTYKLPAGVQIPQQSIIQGRGGADAAFTTALTKIQCATDAVYVVRVDAFGVILERFAVEYTGVGTPTSGAGVYLPASDGMQIGGIQVKGFYDSFVLGGSNWWGDKLTAVDPVRYGFYLTGTRPDQGDAILSNVYALAGPNNNPTAAVYWDTGGGLDIHHLHVNYAWWNYPTLKKFTNGIDLRPTSSTQTSQVNVDDVIIDMVSGDCVHVDVVAPATLSRINFDNVKIRGSGAPARGYYLRNVQGCQIKNGYVDLGSSVSAVAGIDADFVTNLNIENVDFYGVPSNIPCILLGTNVLSASIKLGLISEQAITSTWTAGSKAWILDNKRAGNLAANGGPGFIQLAWKMPTLTSTSVYQTLWELTVKDSNVGSFSFDLELVTTSTAPYTTLTRKRLANYNGGTSALTTVGTDVDSTATQVDINFDTATTAGTVFIQAKRNVAGPATAAGWTVLTIRGPVAIVKAWN
jgi:hypothetical protein